MDVTAGSGNLVGTDAGMRQRAADVEGERQSMVDDLGTTLLLSRAVLPSLY